MMRKKFISKCGPKGQFCFKRNVLWTKEGPNTGTFPPIAAKLDFKTIFDFT